ncbi:hypothetical protein MA16_Dca027936 [Dendrobium catenatum]|uniref:Uncharacterized protein n=1 Tax=Dendrobium catenatum TaxID=906689 RepID=A0A2I0V6P4_9ASPA|nr:hypothetical protein MA16_Dca027936 [Dendrobium catenatum]
MAAKKVDALQGELEKTKSWMEEKFSAIKGRISTMKNQMESRFRRLEQMMRKLVEMQSKTPLAVLIADPNQDLIRIPLAESKGKEIGREEFEEGRRSHEETHDPAASKPHGKSKDLISGFDSLLARVEEVMNGMKVQVEKLGERVNCLEEEDITIHSSIRDLVRQMEESFRDQMA